MTSPRAASGAVLAVLLAAAPISGCARERICSEGEYPVRSIRFPETGRACVEEGEPPPKGYETFPPGEVPEYVDED